MSSVVFAGVVKTVGLSFSKLTNYTTLTLLSINLLISKRNHISAVQRNLLIGLR
jgi:hypothetical protein